MYRTWKRSSTSEVLLFNYRNHVKSGTSRSTTSTPNFRLPSCGHRNFKRISPKLVVTLLPNLKVIRLVHSARGISKSFLYCSALLCPHMLIYAPSSTQIPPNTSSPYLNFCLWLDENLSRVWMIITGKRPFVSVDSLEKPWDCFTICFRLSVVLAFLVEVNCESCPLVTHEVERPA